MGKNSRISSGNNSECFVVFKKYFNTFLFPQLPGNNKCFKELESNLL